MNTMQVNGMPGQPGGAMMMQQQQQQQPQQQQQQQQQQTPNGAMGRALDGADEGRQHKISLNTAIYDYFLKIGQYDLARTLKQSSLPINTADASSNPNKRKADDVDGKDHDPNRPGDLPPAGIPLSGLGYDTAFLLDWFGIFWDISFGKSPATVQYLQYSQNLNRLTQQQRESMMRMGVAGNPQQQQQMMMAQRGMMLPNRNGVLNQQQMMNQRRMMQANAMARDASNGMDVDGNRPHTPSSGDTNAPSPNKRARIEGQPFGPGMVNGMPGQMGDPNDMVTQQNAQRLLMANGINTSGMTSQQMQTFGSQTSQVQNKSIQLYKQNMAAHTMQRANMGGQGSPNMMNPGMDMQAMQSGNGDFYNNNSMNRGVNGQNGHALQDYQQQLMLLERQNRKRLEMAKQEQEGGGFNGQAGNMSMPFAPNMSPSGSRQGPSPNPSEQMKRGTPQLNKGQMPGSPMPDGSQRASPMNYNPMGPGMENGMRVGANGMQPPSSHPNFQNGGPGMTPQQMAAMRNAQGGGPMPGAQGFQPGQQPPMGPGAQQPGANGQMGTPRQTNANMPPPQAVPPTQNATGRAPSPAPSAAANTPQTTNKPNPKKEKAKKDRKPSTKKTGNAAATPADNADSAPQTSAPATPITPAVTSQNNKAFEANKAATNGQVNGAPAAPPAQQVSQPAAPTLDIHGQDGAMIGDFSTDMDFAGIEAGDVLDQFNFDAFITEDGTGNLDNFNFDMAGFEGGMEAGVEQT